MFSHSAVQIEVAQVAMNISQCSSDILNPSTPHCGLKSLLHSPSLFSSPWTGWQKNLPLWFNGMIRIFTICLNPIGWTSGTWSYLTTAKQTYITFGSHRPEKYCSSYSERVRAKWERGSKSSLSVMDIISLL